MILVQGIVCFYNIIWDLIFLPAYSVHCTVFFQRALEHQQYYCTYIHAVGIFMVIFLWKQFHFELQ